MLGVVSARVASNDDELVAAVAVHEVVMVCEDSEQSSHADQESIAGRVTDAVVDVLELVEIDEE